jgi:MerR family transcriptional regulator, heat shock protein HspR
MTRKFFRLAEVIDICGVERDFIARLERERIIQPTMRSKLKYYPREQLDRIRVAHLLMAELGVNMAGTEVALHMREQMIAMQRQFAQVLRRLAEELKRRT